MNILDNKGKLTGILMLAIGIILLVWPVSSLTAFCRLLGVCLIISGAVEILLGLSGSRDLFSTVGGGIALVFGLIFVMRPWFIISFLPVLVGIVVAVAGAMFLLNTLVRHEQGPQAILGIAGGAVALIVGLILIFNWYSSVKLLMVVLGIMLVYFGILRIGRS